MFVLEQEIYCPSKAELKKDELHGHIVLFTGYGCDENNKEYYQFQETAGTSVGDEGYHYVYADFVEMYVEMELWGQVAADGYGIQITTIMEVWSGISE